MSGPMEGAAGLEAWGVGMHCFCLPTVVFAHPPGGVPVNNGSPN